MAHLAVKSRLKSQLGTINFRVEVTPLLRLAIRTHLRTPCSCLCSYIVICRYIYLCHTLGYLALVCLNLVTIGGITWIWVCTKVHPFPIGFRLPKISMVVLIQYHYVRSSIWFCCCHQIICTHDQYIMYITLQSWEGLPIEAFIHENR